MTALLDTMDNATRGRMLAARAALRDLARRATEAADKIETVMPDPTELPPLATKATVLIIRYRNARRAETGGAS